METETHGNERQSGHQQSGNGINEHQGSSDAESSAAPDEAKFNSPEAALDLELFQYNPLETIVVDRLGRVVDYNLAKKASGGRLPSRGDVMYRDYAAKHDIDMHAELIRCIQNGESKNFPSLKYHDKYLRITISPFPKGAIIVSQNVTERTLAEDALRKSEERYRNLFDRVPAGLYRASAAGRFLDVNEALVQMLGFPDKESLLVINVADMYVHPDEFPGMMERLGREATLRDAESRFYRFDGSSIWIKTSAHAVFDAENRIETFEGAVEDITERKRAEEEKQKIQAQLLHAQKMEAVGTLAGGVAHDFNNLLTAIQGCLDLAMLKIPEDGAAFKDLLEVQNASRRAADLTRQLLLFSRRHLTHMVPLRINDTVADLLKMLHRLIGEDIEITTLLDPGLWNVLADKGTIEQIVVNLSVNARDAMPHGGKLCLKTENVVLDDFYCRLVPEARPGQFVHLSIADSGVGMSKETRERIFEPFFSTKGPGKGTGLGLSVVYGIVKQHNGWINVYSEPERGTEFKVYFPAIFTEARRKPPADAEPMNPGGSGERILVVEDEDMVRDFSLRALEKHGYQVSAVSTVQEALAAFGSGSRRFDMVFTDVVLPDGSGLTLLEHVLKADPSVRVVLTSGYTGTKSQWNSIKEKGLHFLQKPFTLQDLLQTVRREFVKPPRSRRT